MSAPTDPLLTRGPIVLPVLHIQSLQQAVEQARVAFDAGAKGLFVIDHHFSRELPLQAAHAIIEAELARTGSKPWVGVNLLGSAPHFALRDVRRKGNGDIPAVWTDESGLKNPGALAVEEAEFTKAGLTPPTLFAGCHFKHQTPMWDLDVEAAAMAETVVGVLTTSGEATGEPCDPGKVAAIRRAVGDRRKVAVASGVSSRNAVELIEAGADVLMVNSLVSHDFHTFDPAKLRELLAVVDRAASQGRGYKTPGVDPLKAGFQSLTEKPGGTP